MKYILSLVMFLILIPEAFADYLEDVKNLGYVSGMGIACGAKRYKAYEMVARAYLVGSAQSDDEQAKGMYEYNTAKAEAYLRKKHDNLWDCDEVNKRFNEQSILKSKLYKDGTLKLPDGKVIKPRQKYDATQLYDKTQDERERLDTYYEKIIEKKRKQAQKEGIYEKIRLLEANISR